MPSYPRVLCGRLRKLCGLNRQLSQVVNRTVAAVCDEFSWQSGAAERRDRSAPDLGDAIRTQQAIFSPPISL